MTRKKIILFFSSYNKISSYTVERYRILVEVDKRFMPADLMCLKKRLKREIETITNDGSCYLLILF